jgi:hypothetical protein
MKALLTPIASLRTTMKIETRIGWTAVRKSENKTVPKGFCSRAKHQKVGNSPSFLTITHMTLSAKWFRSYGILMINGPTLSFPHHAPSRPTLACPSHPHHGPIVLSYSLQCPTAKHRQPK